MSVLAPETPARQAVSATAPVAIALGLAVLAGLWLGPLVPMSRTAFSPHMLLHLGVVVVASPLLGYGISQYLRPPKTLGEAFSWCFLAAAFETTAVWGWHIPLLHDAQGHNFTLFVLEQLSFLAAGLGLWTAAFAAGGPRTAAAPLLALLLTFSHMTMFGLVLTLAPRLIYDPNLCRGAFGFGRLADQQLGGILMAIGGGLPYLLGTAWAAWQLLNRSAGSSGSTPTVRRTDRDAPP
jgi:putative membrane protein